MKPVIGFAGMTHLGLVSGVCAAEKGFEVVGFDTDPERIARLEQGELPVSEPQLAELLRNNSQRISFSSAPASLGRCDVIYVAPDVATNDEGQSDLSAINLLLGVVDASAREDAVMVILSQVPPGFTRGAGLSHRTLYYQVETLVFGRAVERALLPERYIVGARVPGDRLPAQYAAFLAAHDCPVLTMRYESAELAKISINMCLVASVTTANTLAELCERIGADWSEIVPALRLDRRIGQHAYLAPGLGIAGGNLERDLATVIQFADRHHTDAGVVKSWIANSKHRKNWAAETIQATVLDKNPGAVIAVWGLAYKENTHSTKGSPSIHTIARLPTTRFRVHDPQVEFPGPARENVEQFASALEAAAGADALMILTPWPEYRQIAPGEIAARMLGVTVIDPYSVLEPSLTAVAGLGLHTMGRPLVIPATA